MAHGARDRATVGLGEGREGRTGRDDPDTTAGLGSRLRHHRPDAGWPEGLSDLRLESYDDRLNVAPCDHRAPTITCPAHTETPPRRPRRRFPRVLSRPNHKEDPATQGNRAAGLLRRPERRRLLQVRLHAAACDGVHLRRLRDHDGLLRRGSDHPSQSGSVRRPGRNLDSVRLDLRLSGSDRNISSETRSFGIRDGDSVG